MKSEFARPLICLLSGILVQASIASAQDEALMTVSESYFSEAEGRKQRFQVVLPPGYSKEKRHARTRVTGKRTG